MEPISDDENPNYGLHSHVGSASSERGNGNFSGPVNFCGGMIEMNGSSTNGTVSQPQDDANHNHSAVAPTSVPRSDFIPIPSQKWASTQYTEHAHVAGNYQKGNQHYGGNGGGSTMEVTLPEFHTATERESRCQESNPEYFKTEASLPCIEDISEDENEALSEEYIRNGICLVPSLPSSDELEQCGNGGEHQHPNADDNGGIETVTRPESHPCDSDVDVESVSQRSESVYVRNGEGLTSPRSPSTDDEITIISNQSNSNYQPTASNGVHLNQPPPYIEVMSGREGGNQALGCPDYDCSGVQFNQPPHYVEFMSGPEGGSQGLGSEYHSNGICLDPPPQYGAGMPQAQYDNQSLRSGYFESGAPPVSSIPFGEPMYQAGNGVHQGPATHPVYNYVEAHIEGGNQQSSSEYYQNAWNTVPPAFPPPNNGTVSMAGYENQRSDSKYYRSPSAIYGPLAMHVPAPGHHHHSMSQQQFHGSDESAFAQVHGTKRRNQGSSQDPKRPRRRYVTIKELTARLNTIGNGDSTAVASTSSTISTSTATSTWVPPTELNQNTVGESQTNTQTTGDSGKQINQIIFTDHPGAITVSMPGGEPFLKVPLMSAITSTLTFKSPQETSVTRSKSKPRTVVYRSESYKRQQLGYSLPVAQPLPARTDNSDNEDDSTRDQQTSGKGLPQTHLKSTTLQTQPKPTKKVRISNAGTIEDEDEPKKPPKMPKSDEVDQEKKLRLKIRKDKGKKRKTKKVRSQSTPEPGPSSGKVKKKGIRRIKDGIRKRKPLRKRERSSSVEFLLEVPRSTEPNDQVEGIDLSLSKDSGTGVRGVKLESVVHQQANLDMPDIFNFQSDVPNPQTVESISTIAEVQSAENAIADGEKVDDQRASNITGTNDEVQITTKVADDADDTLRVQSGKTGHGESVEVQNEANSVNDTVEVESATNILPSAEAHNSTSNADSLAEVRSSTNDSSQDIIIILEKEKVEKRLEIPTPPPPPKKQDTLNSSCYDEAVSITCSPNGPNSPLSPISSSEADEFEEVVESLSVNKSNSINSNPPEETGGKETVPEKEPNQLPPVSPVVATSSSDNNRGCISVIVNNHIRKEPVQQVPPVGYVGVIVHTSSLRQSQSNSSPIERVPRGVTSLADNQLVNNAVQSELPSNEPSASAPQISNVQARHVKSPCNDGLAYLSGNNDEFQKDALDMTSATLRQLQQDQNGRVIGNVANINDDNSNQVPITDNVISPQIRQRLHASNYTLYDVVPVPPAHQQELSHFTALSEDCPFVLGCSTGPHSHLHQLYMATTMPQSTRHSPFDYRKETRRQPQISGTVSEAGTSRTNQPRAHNLATTTTPAASASMNPPISGTSTGGMSNTSKSTLEDSRLHPAGRIREMDANGNIIVRRVAHRLAIERSVFPAGALFPVDSECEPKESTTADDNPPKRVRSRSKKADDDAAPKRGRPKKSDGDNPPKRGRPKKSDVGNPPKRGRSKKSDDDDNAPKRQRKKPKENATLRKVSGIYQRLQKDVNKIYKLGPSPNNTSGPSKQRSTSNESSLSVPGPVEKRLRTKRGGNTPPQTKKSLEDKVEEVSSDDDSLVIIEEVRILENDHPEVADKIPNDENHKADKQQPQSDSDTQQSASASSPSDNDDEDILSLHADDDLDML